MSVIREVAAGGAWLLASTIVATAAGAGLWLLAGRLLSLEDVGVATAVISAAMTASIIAASGLDIAVVRECAARRGEGVAASLLLATLLSIAASLLAYALSLLQGALLPVYASLIALTSLEANIAARALIGLGLFRSFFTAVASMNAVKILLAVVLIYAVGSAAAPLLAILAGNIAGLLAALPPLLSSRPTMPRAAELRRLYALALSNYPFTVSSQLAVALSIYVYSVVSGAGRGTGVLYLSMMLFLVLAAIPGSLLGSALSVGVRRGRDPYLESLRLGLGLVTPVAALVAMEPSLLLSIVKPELAHEWRVLTLLVAGLAPYAGVASAIYSMNHRLDLKGILGVGLVRLATLALATPLLAMLAGVEGAALAFTLSNIVALAAAELRVKGVTQTVLNSTLVLAAVSIASILAPQATLYRHVAAVLAPLATLLLLHVTNDVKVEEVTRLIRWMLEGITG